VLLWTADWVSSDIARSCLHAPSAYCTASMASGALKYYFTDVVVPITWCTSTIAAYAGHLSVQVDTHELEELGLKRHPDEVAEAASLASVQVPEVHTRLKLPGHVLESKLLPAQASSEQQGSSCVQ
jgi:hypothetical protein